MLRPAARHLLVQRVDVREAATQHDHVRIDDVDDRGERARQPIDVARERESRVRVGSRGAARQRLGVGPPAGPARRVLGPPRTRQKRLDAAAAPAVAGRARPLIVERRGQRIVAPFAGDVMRAFENPCR